MKNPWSVTILLFIAIVSTRYVSGAPAARLSLGSLCAEADAVAIGNFVSAVLSGSDTLLTIQVIRSQKGSVMAGSVVQVRIPSPGLTDAVSPKHLEGVAGMWFLRNNGTVWIALPVAAGSVLLIDYFIHVPSSTAPVAYASPFSSLIGRVAKELIDAAQDPNTATEVTNLLASGAVDDFDTSVLAPMWADLAASSASPAWGAGLAGQIRMGSSSALKALASAVYVDTIQPCAVHALRAIHTRQAVRYLSPFLDSGVPVWRMKRSPEWLLSPTASRSRRLKILPTCNF